MTRALAARVVASNPAPTAPRPYQVRPRRRARMHVLPTSSFRILQQYSTDSVKAPVNVGPGSRSHLSQAALPRVCPQFEHRAYYAAAGRAGGPCQRPQCHHIPGYRQWQDVHRCPACTPQARCSQGGWQVGASPGTPTNFAAATQTLNSHLCRLTTATTEQHAAAAASPGQAHHACTRPRSVAPPLVPASLQRSCAF